MNLYCEFNLICKGSFLAFNGCALEKQMGRRPWRVQREYQWGRAIRHMLKTV